MVSICCRNCSTRLAVLTEVDLGCLPWFPPFPPEKEHLLTQEGLPPPPPEEDNDREDDRQDEDGGDCQQGGQANVESQDGAVP